MNEKRNDDIYYVCTMIEYVARVTKNHRKDIVARISKKDMEHELKVAEVNHCLSFEQVSDEWIEQYGIVEGNFDTVTTCKYNVPSVTSIGRVYQQLVLATAEKDEEAQAIKDVFASFISDEISYFNSNVYYSNPDYLRCSYQEGALLAQIAQYVKNALDYIKANPWDQRKVREVADRYDNLRIPVAANLRIPGSTPYYGANGIQDYVDGYTHEGEFILVAEDGANDLKNYPVKCVKGRIWVNNHAHVLQGKNEIADNKFLAFAISQADIESLLVGGSRAKLNAETLMEIDLLLPEKQEQVSIGNYLTNLDHLITLHQRKAKMLQFIKKIMIEKMFVPQQKGKYMSGNAKAVYCMKRSGNTINIHIEFRIEWK